MNSRMFALGQLRNRLEESFEDNTLLIEILGPDNNRLILDRARVTVKSSTVYLEVDLRGIEHPVLGPGTAEAAPGEAGDQLLAPGISGLWSDGDEPTHSSGRIELGEAGGLL